MKKQKMFVLCESIQQVNWLLRQHKLKESISDIISANPSATWGLQKHNINFVSIEKFHINKSSEEIESQLLKQINWAKNLDMFLQKTIPDFKLTLFCPARNYLYYLKNRWDTFIQRADLLEQIFKKETPEEVFFFGNQHPISYDSVLTISGSTLSECIPVWAEYHGIKFTALPAVSGDMFWQRQDPIKKGIRQRIISKFSPLMITHIQSIINNPLLSNFPSSFLSFDTKAKIFVKSSYDLTHDISLQLWKNGIDPRSFSSAVARSQKYSGTLPSITQSLTEAWQQVTELEWFWQPGGRQNWSLRNGLKPLFYHFWFNIIPELWKSMNGSRILIQQQSPLAVCVPVIWGPDETGFIMAAHTEKIPVIFYQHGASMGDVMNPIWDLTDSFYSDYQLVYGEGAANYVRSRCIHSGLDAVPIPVGSARLDQVGSGMLDKKILALRRSILGNNDMPHVVYVPGIFSNNFFRYDYRDLQDCRIFDLRCRLAEIFNNHPEVRFSYKTFVSLGHDPTLEMLKETCPECSIIDTDVPLTELQWAADLLIYEDASTGMYEGLVTDKPMIVYSYRLLDEAKNMLEKRVRVAENIEELIEKIKQFLDIEDFSPLVNPNREFVKAFCTYLDDGQSAHRAADTIAMIVKNKIDHPFD
jgi:hypothetical protein